MIRNQWYVILESREVKARRPLGVTRVGEKLVLWRKPDGQVVCMRDLCPHLGAPLCMGKVKGDRLACPFHAFEYDASGQCCYLPAFGRNGEIPKALRVGIYPTYEAHGLIWIYWGEPKADLQPPKFFDSITPDFSYSTFVQRWPVHYSRMVENQLDVSHLPFVHHDTIGRGGRTIVDGPQVNVQGDLLEVWVYNRVDDGVPARKANEMPPPERRPFLQFRFPNIWHNWISDDVRVFVAFVPVDEENGLLYGRFYQRFMRVPILRELVNFSGKLGSIKIAAQDQRIVTRQLPKRTSLRMGEKILQSDGAILAYRRQREKLLQENNPG
jgi:phenylpropionate dioxygenase-like ring-hydroxylating dioxygenase large terminal subunit